MNLFGRVLGSLGHNLGSIWGVLGVSWHPFWGSEGSLGNHFPSSGGPLVALGGQWSLRAPPVAAEGPPQCAPWAAQAAFWSHFLTIFRMRFRHFEALFCN